MQIRARHPARQALFASLIHHDGFDTDQVAGQTRLADRLRDALTPRAHLSTIIPANADRVPSRA